MKKKRGRRREGDNRKGKIEKETENR
jgi:hypothetical protein